MVPLNWLALLKSHKLDTTTGTEACRVSFLEHMQLSIIRFLRSAVTSPFVLGLSVSAMAVLWPTTLMAGSSFLYSAIDGHLEILA